MGRVATNPSCTRALFLSSFRVGHPMGMWLWLWLLQAVGVEHPQGCSSSSNHCSRLPRLSHGGDGVASRFPGFPWQHVLFMTTGFQTQYKSVSAGGEQGPSMW